jgi:hypothetical protein
MKAFHGVCMLLVSAWVFFACGIQSFEDLADLNPPLALHVKVNVTPRSLELTFISFNYENNFSGFNVFVGIDDTDVIRQTRAIPNIRTENIPTFITNNAYFKDQPREITLIITEAHRAIEPLKTMG